MWGNLKIHVFRSLKTSTHWKTKFLEGWLYKSDVLGQDLLQLPSSVTDVTQN